MSPSQWFLDLKKLKKTIRKKKEQTETESLNKRKRRKPTKLTENTKPKSSNQQNWKPLPINELYGE